MRLFISGRKGSLSINFYTRTFLVSVFVLESIVQLFYEVSFQAEIGLTVSKPLLV